MDKTLILTLVLFLMACKPSGNPTVPCQGKSCFKKTQLPSETPDDDIDDPIIDDDDDPPPSGEGKASATCKFEFDFVTDHPLDKPAGFTPYTNARMIAPATDKIRDIIETTTADFKNVGFPVDLMLSATDNFTYRCLEASLKKHIELEAKYCPSSNRPKRIRSVTTIDVTYKDNRTEPFTMQTKTKELNCKSQDLISGQSVYGGLIPGGTSPIQGQTLCLGPACDRSAVFYGTHRDNKNIFVLNADNTPALDAFLSKPNAFPVIDRIELRAAYQASKLAPCGDSFAGLTIMVPVIDPIEATRGSDHYLIGVGNIYFNGTMGNIIRIPVNRSTQGWITFSSCTPVSIKDLRVYVR